MTEAEEELIMLMMKSHECVTSSEMQVLIWKTEMYFNCVSLTQNNGAEEL